MVNPTWQELVHDSDDVEDEDERHRDLDHEEDADHHNQHTSGRMHQSRMQYCRALVRQQLQRYFSLLLLEVHRATH